MPRLPFLVIEGGLHPILRRERERVSPVLLFLTRRGDNFSGGHVLLPLENIKGVLDVIMTGKSLVALHSRKAIPVRVGFHAIKKLVAPVKRSKPENTQLLLCARRRIEPGHPATISLEVLTDTDAES